MTQPIIQNVSDTARWVAFHRAQETRRPDALFTDRLAERLAGERGRAIAAVAPRSSRNGWPVIARTKLIDELIVASAADGCDCIINLAAGFDTRPYRLPLAPSLRFVEADLPALIEQKTQLLAGETPVCQLTRVAVDLTDAAARGEFLEHALRGASKCLVLSEGLLCYLTESVVRELSADLSARAAVSWWVLDLFSPAVRQLMNQRMGAQLISAPMQFAPASGVAFFEALGWETLDTRSIFHGAARLGRLPLALRPFGWLPEPNPRELRDKRWSGVLRLGRRHG